MSVHAACGYMMFVTSCACTPPTTALLCDATEYNVPQRPLNSDAICDFMIVKSYDIKYLKALLNGGT